MGLPYCDVRKFSIIDGLAANTISDIAQTPDRLMWFSTWNGISYYDGNSFHTFRDDADDIDLLSTNRFMGIYATARNNVWCITASRRLYAYETILCTFVPVGDNINKLYNIDLRVDKIYPIKHDNTWVTTKSGDYLIRINGLQREGNIPELIKVGQDGLRSGNVWHIWADKKKRDWILTDKGTTIYHSQFSTPIPFKWIREVGDNVFLATEDGRLAVFDENNKLNMIPLPAGVTRINQLKNTGYQLLIATNLGMIIYNPRTFKTEIINVQSPSQPLAEVKSKYQMKYRYRLEGHTPPGKWIDNGSSNTIGFNRISQGDYILKVSATNSHGVWSKYIAEIPIEVRPTFWESIWGRLTLLLLLAAVVASIFYSYNWKQREKLEHEMSLMKNEFFSDASHKLRTPLTLIGGPLQHVLDTEHGITRNSREMLVIALKNSREMLNMLNKVLRFDDNANFLVNGGLNENVNEEGNEMEKVEGEIDDTTVSKYLKELEEEKKKEKAKHEEEENQKGTAPNKPSKNLTILVVEDNSDLRLYLNSVLEEKYNVLLAENGKVGLYKARTEMPDFILTDVTMPVMDGITMIREIKQDRTISHIPIIILSAKASVEDQLKGFEQGVDGYLTKPFSTSYLMGRIEAAINKRKATQTDIAKMMKQNGNVGYTGKAGNTGNTGNTEAAEISQPATEPRKTLSELNFDIQEKERLAEEKKSKMKSYAFMESQINDKTMGRILKYVTDNMGSPDLKIDDIADAIGMSRSVLYNKIKQAVGMTPIDFVRHIRIMRACELLQQTNDPLTSIAFEVGFSDPKYFSKVFKKELGIVPSEYRERTKE